MKKRNEKDEVISAYEPLGAGKNSRRTPTNRSNRNSKKKISYSSGRKIIQGEILRKYFKSTKRDKVNNSFTISFNDITNTSTTKLPEIKLNRLGFESQKQIKHKRRIKRRVKKFYSKLSSVVLKDIPKDKRNIISKFGIKQPSIRKKKKKVNSVDIFWLRKENQKLKELGYEIKNLDYFVKEEEKKKSRSVHPVKKNRGYYGLRSVSVID